MACCPHCAGTGQVPDAIDTATQLRTACNDRGIWRSADDRVREADAAEFLGWQPKTMRNRRYEDAPIPFVIRQGRPLYSIADLAAWIDAA
jgi:hypothetical protein